MNRTSPSPSTSTSTSSWAWADRISDAIEATAARLAREDGEAWADRISDAIARIAREGNEAQPARPCK